jgi:uncharacterized protein (TIGR03546 family)
MLITWIAKLIAGLNANRRAGEIAAGVSMGVLLALIPGANLLWLLIFVLTVFLKLNLGIELLVLAILKPIAPLGDPLLHTLGVSEELFGLFTSLYNVPLLPFTRFNNTVVMGGVVAGLLLWLPIFFLSRVLVRVYRKRIHPRLAESKIVKAFQRVPIVSKLIAITRRFQRVYAAVR